jgi:hypothetical protein
VSSESSPSFVDENLRKNLEEKEQELNEIRKKTQLFQDEQLKKVSLPSCLSYCGN